MFALKLFKMAANQTECSLLEQNYVIKFLVVEKCKPCEIYWRVCNVYGEAYFSQKMFTNKLNITVHRVETQFLSGEEKKNPGLAKKVMLIIFWDM